MEMNTRLQVEHPVTEAITGVDLVEWQLRIAAANLLPSSRKKLGINGWAMEARLYAGGSRRKGFLPSTGRLEHFSLPVSAADGSVRVDSGVEEEDEISPFYDPMIAKLIAYGEDRAEAIGRLADMLDSTEVWPVRTNAGFLFQLATAS
jgi:3-methylcrotonyl-CoA carboxylase alpha subunit